MIRKIKMTAAYVLFAKSQIVASSSKTTIPVAALPKRSKSKTRPDILASCASSSSPSFARN